MWHKKNGRRGFLGSLKSLFNKPARKTRKSSRRGHSEVLEDRIVLSAQYVENHVLIGLQPGASEAIQDAVASSIFESELQPLGNYGVFLMTLPSGVAVPNAINTLRTIPGVRYAEPDWIGEWTAIPNDPEFSRQWGLRNIGQTVNGVTGTFDADIDANQAWDQTIGNNNVIVAIVDSGVDVLHPDLVANMWVNTSEIAGNGVDDDGNGFVDDINGYDFGSGDGNPMDFVGHGTHVAGIVGAVADNGIGVSGVNWDVSLMALKIGTDHGGPTNSGAIAAINYAVAMGATVSNHSYGVNPTQALQDAITNAQANNHIVVVAAGNSSSNNDVFPAYPASYPQDNIIAVAATDSRDNLATFSSYGLTSVDIGAPGVDIFSTVPTAGSDFYPTRNGYEFSDGTSMASPMVAGAVALLRSVAPTIPYTQIISALYQGADPLASLTGRVATGARLNVNNALQFLQVATVTLSRTSVREDAGAGAATLTIRKSNFPLDQAMTVDLLISDLTEANIPALGGSTTVTIPAGQRQVSFFVSAIDDTLLDGTQTVIFDLQYQGSSINTAVLQVTDVEEITVVANPTTVVENAGAGAGTLTISRSNTDVFAPSRVVAVGNQLRFFNRSGVQTGSSVTVPWPTGVRPASQVVRDVTMMEDGRVAVFNGTSLVYISLYNPTTQAWSHRFISGATASSSDNTTGGISTTGNYVFISDLETSNGDAFGLVRFDVVTNSVTRFGTKSFGNRLFGTTWPESDIREIDPVTGTVIRTLTSPGTSGGDAGLAFDGTHIWYINEGSDSLFKIDAETNAVVDTYNVGTGTNSGFEGLAYMNGLIYLLDPFISNQIVVFDPVLRSTVRRIFLTVDVSGGLAPNPARNSLYVTATFSDSIYEVSALDGTIVRQFASGEYWDAGLATVGDRLYVGTQSGANTPIRIFTLDGVFTGVIPWNNFFGAYSLGGDGIQGLVNTPYRYRDVVAGLDGFIYSLDTTGTTLAKFDPVTLSPVSFLTIEEPIQSFSVDASGVVWAVNASGEVLELNSSGKVAARLATGLGLLSDIEVNISGDIIVGATNGSFAYVAPGLASFVSYASGGAGTVFAAFGEHASKNRGQLVVSLQNSDTTELAFAATVTIPEGQQTVVIPFDAVDDNFRDGQQTVTITASAAGYEDGTETVNVADFEGVVVDVVETTVAENAGPRSSLVNVRRTDIEGPYSYVTSQSFSNNTISYIPDRGTIRSAITVPSQISWLLDVDVTVSFQHTWVADLDVYLVSPSGTRVELFTDLSSNSPLITNATLDDSATTSIRNGASPYTGSYMPESRLDALYHEQTAGTWYLEVTDDNTFDIGALLSWSLTLKTEGLAAAAVILTTSDPTEALLDGQNQKVLIIPANQSEVSFWLDSVDDTILDGPQVVTVEVVSSDTPNLDLGSDTVVVSDYEQITFTVSGTSVSEAAGPGALTGTITRLNSDLALPYTVTLMSSDTSELTVPATVTIPAGASSVTFPIDAVDDAVIDGTQSVNITIGAPDYVGMKTRAINVEDLEPSLRLSTTTGTVAENAGSLEVTLRRLDQADISQPFVANLMVSSVTPGGVALSVPATVTIPGGSDSVTFVVGVLDDALLDGTQITRITASQTNIISGTIDINVTDVESVSVVVNPIEFYENGGSNAAVGTVSRSNTDTSLPLTVSLASSDTTEARVPATVTIPAGASSVNFDIAAVNDPDLDGPQSVILTASAVGYVSGSTTVTVLDHEPPVILTPAATTLNARPVITWQAIPGAIRYELMVSNLSTGVNQLIYRTNLTGTSFTPSENLGIGRYRTWVRAVDTLERPGFWSVPKDFKVETAPAFTAPVVTGTQASPSFPELAWTAVADASRYELWINNVTTGAVRVLYKTDIVTTAYKSLDGFGSGLYRAFVRAANAQNEFGQWSAAINFTVLAAPSIISPATGGSFDRTPTFTWNAIAGATSYDLWVSSRTLNRVYLRNLSVRTNSFTATSDFVNGDYTVWVRAQGGQYFSPWSAARQFSIGMPPVISSPTAGSSNSGRPTFSWSSISDAERYELWITDTVRNTRILLTNLTTTTYTPATALAASTYRVWVRAVSIMGEFSAWSTPVTFTVATISPDAQLPLLQLPELTAFNSSTPRKVATRPSAASDAARFVEQAPVSVQEMTRGNMVAQADRSVSEEITDSSVFDAVMSDWSGAEWWQAPVTVESDRKSTVKS
jgi:subtilisin family serine protease/subtilisin-like proprotein convertase family protein